MPSICPFECDYAYQGLGIFLLCLYYVNWAYYQRNKRVMNFLIIHTDSSSMLWTSYPSKLNVQYAKSVHGSNEQYAKCTNTKNHCNLLSECTFRVWRNTRVHFGHCPFYPCSVHFAYTYIAFRKVQFAIKPTILQNSQHHIDWRGKKDGSLV